MLLSSRMSASRRRSGGSSPVGPQGSKWRIFITDTMARFTSGDGNAAASEIEMRATPAGANLATVSSNAISSSEFSGSYADDYAFNGNGDSDFWVSSGGLPAIYIGYDFGSDTTIEQIAWLPRTGLADEAPLKGQIEYWDGAAWQLAWPIFDFTGYTDNVAKLFTIPATGDRWRVNVNSSGSGVLGFAEVSMRLTSGGANQCSGGKPDAISAFNTSYMPGNAFDGSSGTEWATVNGAGYTDQWIGYDFLTSKDIHEVALTARAGADGLQGGGTFDFQRYNMSTHTWDTIWSSSFSGFSGGQTQVFTRP